MLCQAQGQAHNHPSLGLFFWSFRKFPSNNAGHQLLLLDQALRRQMGHKCGRLRKEPGDPTKGSEGPNSQLESTREGLSPRPWETRGIKRLIPPSEGTTFCSIFTSLPWKLPHLQGRTKGEQRGNWEPVYKHGRSVSLIQQCHRSLVAIL